jgi:hypothetical protein
MPGFDPVIATRGVLIGPPFSTVCDTAGHAIDALNASPE